MVNYKNGIIYKICCKDTNISETYVGSTINFSRRKSKHKQDCKNLSKTLNVYNFIRLNGGIDNWDFIMIEKYEAEDRFDLQRRERFWLEEIAKTNKTLNVLIPGLLDEEKQQQKKEYRQRPEVIEKKREYSRRPDVKEKRKEYEKKPYVVERKSTDDYKSRTKETKNKSYIKNYQQSYERKKLRRQQNPELRRLKYTCTICNKELSKENKTRHEKTKQHLDNLNKGE